jgi:hypothetical protein
MKATYKIQGMVIHCSCSDGKLREVAMTPVQANLVGKTLRHVSNGTITLYPTPVRVVADEPWLVRKLHSLGTLVRRKKKA